MICVQSFMNLFVLLLQTLYFLYDPGAAPGGDPMELGLTLIASVTSTGDGDSFSIP